MDASKYITVPLSDLTTPKNGRICLCDRWWIVNEKDEALFFRHITSPQCNSEKSIAERLKPEGCRVEFVPVAYVKHNCSDYL